MDVFWLFLLIPHSHCLEVRASEWVRGREARRGWLLCNFCCTTRLVMHAPLLGPAPRGVCVREMGRDGAHRVVCTAARRWARGLLLIVQLSLLIMSLSNQCKRRQEPKWHFSTLITRVSFVAPLSFTFTHLQSSWIEFFTRVDHMVGFIWEQCTSGKPLNDVWGPEIKMCS